MTRAFELGAPLIGPSFTHTRKPAHLNAPHFALQRRGTLRMSRTLIS